MFISILIVELIHLNVWCTWKITN